MVYLFVKDPASYHRTVLTAGPECVIYTHCRDSWTVRHSLVGNATAAALSTSFPSAEGPSKGHAVKSPLRHLKCTVRPLWKCLRWHGLLHPAVPRGLPQWLSGYRWVRNHEINPYYDYIEIFLNQGGKRPPHTGSRDSGYTGSQKAMLQPTQFKLRPHSW